MHDNIHRRGTFGQMPLDRRSHSAANPVPLHRSAKQLADRKTHARACGIITPSVKSQDACRKIFPAFMVNRLEVRVLEQSRTLRKFLQKGRTTVHSWLSGRRLLAESIHGNQVSLKPACGLWRGDGTRPPDHPWFSFSCEIRASWNGDDG